MVRSSRSSTSSAQVDGQSCGQAEAPIRRAAARSRTASVTPSTFRRLRCRMHAPPNEAGRQYDNSSGDGGCVVENLRIDRVEYAQHEGIASEDVAGHPAEDCGTAPDQDRKAFHQPENDG